MVGRRDLRGIPAVCYLSTRAETEWKERYPHSVRQELELCILS